MQIPSKFYTEFAGKITNERWNAFSLIYENLRGLTTPLVIIETGILRKLNDWNQDGNSTALWNYIAKERNGKYIGIDIDPAAIELCKKNFLDGEYICGDSIAALRSLPALSEASLLYLDSYDLDISNPQPAAIHNTGELLAAYSALPSGCLIAIDDSNISIGNNGIADSGKNLISKYVLQSLNATRLADGYIEVWQKP